MDAESLLHLLTSLRAVRHFAADPVSDKDLHQIVEAARWTGSARNRQPWRFAIVRTHTIRQPLAALGTYAHHIAAAPVAIAIATNTEIGGRDTSFDAGRACQNITLAAHALGLASCPATIYPQRHAAKAALLTGLAAPWKVEHVVSIGHSGPRPHGSAAIAQGRLPLDTLLSEP